MVVSCCQKHTVRKIESSVSTIMSSNASSPLSRAALEDRFKLTEGETAVNEGLTRNDRWKSECPCNTCSHCSLIMLARHVCCKCLNTKREALLTLLCFRSVTKQLIAFLSSSYVSGRCNRWCHLGLTARLGYSRKYSS